MAAFAQHHGTVDVLFFQQKEASHQSERLFQSAFRLVHVRCFGISFIFPNYLQIGLHQNTVTAGLFMLPGATFVFLLAPVSGRLMDELGYFKPIVFGLTLASLGLAFLAFVLPNAGVKLLLCGDIATKIGMGLAASSLVATSLSQLEREESIDGNSVLNTLQQFSCRFRGLWLGSKNDAKRQHGRQSHFDRAYSGDNLDRIGIGAEIKV